MIPVAGNLPIHLCCQSVDMRKNFDGLCAIVTNGFGKDPLHDGVFVFVNKSRDKMKLLVWDRYGFWLHYMRLEAGRFQMPPADTAAGATHEAMRVTAEQLLLIVEGIDLSSVRRRKRYDSSRTTT